MYMFHIKPIVFASFEARYQIISNHIIYYIISCHITSRIVFASFEARYQIISYITSYHVVSHLVLYSRHLKRDIKSYHILHHIMSYHITSHTFYHITYVLYTKIISYIPYDIISNIISYLLCLIWIFKISYRLLWKQGLIAYCSWAWLILDYNMCSR